MNVVVVVVLVGLVSKVLLLLLVTAVVANKNRSGVGVGRVWCRRWWYGDDTIGDGLTAWP